MGWYNGDWQTGIPGLPNWFESNTYYSRVYDDFVVPEGGWTVVGAFCNNAVFEFPRVKRAVWDIRRDMSRGKGGKVVASGRAKATSTPVVSRRENPDGSLCRIEVKGLRVQLPPGRYWISVSPEGTGQSFLAATKGANAAGEPPGNNGRTLVNALIRVPIFGMPNAAARSTGNTHFEEAEAVAEYGKVGLGKDFSQGVIVLAPR